MTDATNATRRFGPVAIAIAAVAGLAAGVGAGFGIGAVTGGSASGSERLESAVRGCTATPGGEADVANFATVTDGTRLEYVAGGALEEGANTHYANMSCLLSSVGVGTIEFPAILQGPYDLSFETDLATATVTGDDFDSATLTIELR